MLTLDQKIAAAIKEIESRGLIASQNKHYVERISALDDTGLFVYTINVITGETIHHINSGSAFYDDLRSIQEKALIRKDGSKKAIFSISNWLA